MGGKPRPRRSVIEELGSIKEFKETSPEEFDRILKEAVEAAKKAIAELEAKNRNAGCQCCACRRY